MHLSFSLTHLYPERMAIYGDMGNVHALRWTLESMNIEMKYQPVEYGEKLPDHTDMYFMGGGQDEQQFEIYDDLQTKFDQIAEDVHRGVPLLAICGGYQLFGQEFVTGQGKVIPGLGLFPVSTKAPDDSVKSRCIGNIVEVCNIPQLTGIQLVGFENHSGQTYFVDNYLSPAPYPLGRVVVGKGNNDSEGLEGCVVQHAVGTYLHGSCLPKNPELTEFFIRKGFEAKGVNELPDFPDQSIAIQAKLKIIDMVSR